MEGSTCGATTQRQLSPHPTHAGCVLASTRTLHLRSCQRSLPFHPAALAAASAGLLQWCSGDCGAKEEMREDEGGLRGGIRKKRRVSVHSRQCLYHQLLCPTLTVA